MKKIIFGIVILALFVASCTDGSRRIDINSNPVPLEAFVGQIDVMTSFLINSNKNSEGALFRVFKEYESNPEKGFQMAFENGYLDIVKFKGIATELEKKGKAVKDNFTEKEFLAYLNERNGNTASLGQGPCSSTFDITVLAASAEYGACLLSSLTTTGGTAASLCTFAYGLAVSIADDKYEKCMEETYGDNDPG